jgi:formamidopyrimidine-DNA glycosylase
MPELPEVETIKNGVAKYATGKVIKDIKIYQSRLRWPVSKELQKNTVRGKIDSVTRRGKYLLLNMTAGSIIMHFGMSGRLKILTESLPLLKHDHLDIELNDCLLRFNDPRRFGSVLWATDPLKHPLLAELGPEPLSDGFNHDYFFAITQKRIMPIKNLLMQSHVVVGIGNIYVSEVLFLAKLHPLMPSNQITKRQCGEIVKFSKEVLTNAIANQGTTFRDYVDAGGRRGNFQKLLKVYGREGEACYKCGATIRKVSVGQRSSFFCPKCQPVSND